MRLQGRERQTVSRSHRTYADDERKWEVGRFCSTREVAERDFTQNPSQSLSAPGRVMNAIDSMTMPAPTPE